MNMKLYGIYTWKHPSQVLMGIKRLQTYQEGFRNRVVESFSAQKMTRMHQTNELLLEQPPC